MSTKSKRSISGDGGKFRIFEWVIQFKEKYGVLNIITSGILLIFMSLVLTVAFNPSIVFDKYREYDEMKHAQSFNYRMKSNKATQLILKDILEETKAQRCLIIEMHNGKSNSTGLSFNYGTATYECVNDSVESIREDYTEFTLERYPLMMKVYDEGQWCGTTDELMQYDKKLAMKLKSNDTYGIAITTIYGIRSEIGFLVLSFGETHSKCNREEMANMMRKYAAEISPLLDGERIK